MGSVGCSAAYVLMVMGNEPTVDDFTVLRMTGLLGRLDESASVVY